MRKSYPWRLAPTLDGVSINRSFRFSALLDRLPADERKVIETAERAYLTKTASPNSFHSRVYQYSREGLEGFQEIIAVGFEERLHVNDGVLLLKL